jgi:hypothetical protein
MGNGGGRVHGPGHGLANNNSSERDDGPRTSGRARLVHMLRSTELPSAFRHSAVVYSLNSAEPETVFCSRGCIPGFDGLERLEG